ncbi:MAG: Mobile element protein [Amycolatopsis sp.]|uniref:transposase n=1 Tax=Amycolatopsis sp. TaxID=37632 RepID=UPI00261B4478|nr:transposase [Amycolatopsis sp.]MCU1682820.1 Mobile element protein [Amycolatopsis sp.]
MEVEVTADETATSEPPGADARPDQAAQTEFAVRLKERYAAIRALRAQGKGLRTIGHELGVDRKTVRRILNAESVEELLAMTTSRVTLLDEYKSHLYQRWHQGCTDVSHLYGEIREQGYRGSARTVYRYLQGLRTDRPTPETTKPIPPPKIRHVVGWMMRDPQNLSERDCLQLKGILARCPELETTRRHVGAFATMIRDLRGDLLPVWMDCVRSDDLPALHSFVTGLRHDLTAVTAGLTLLWSNGPTEGAVNRIKMLKRQTYGLASFSLLRKRILHTT